jgi:hypothetical protein
MYGELKKLKLNIYLNAIVLLASAIAMAKENKEKRTA